MSVGLDHPVVATFLARLEAAAAGLPPGRREELVAELREHLGEALAGVDDDEAAVRQVVERLGSPHDIVAAEEVAPVPPAAPGWSPAAAVPTSGGPAVKGVGGSPWGPLEIAAVLLLTVGMFVLPVVGPVAGLVCAWISDRWRRREKVVATIWTMLPVVVAVFAVSSVLAFRTEVGPAAVTVEPTVTVPADPVPADPVPADPTP